MEEQTNKKIRQKWKNRLIRKQKEQTDKKKEEHGRTD